MNNYFLTPVKNYLSNLRNDRLTSWQFILTALLVFFLFWFIQYLLDIVFAVYSN
jgi:hypothetical protein